MAQNAPDQINIFNPQLWRSFWEISKPYWFTDKKKKARMLLGSLLFLLFAFTGMSLVISYAMRDFMTALSERDITNFNHSLLVCLGVFIVATPVSALFDYVRRLLGINWREWLTRKYLKNYFDNRAYYHINDCRDIDNPDQRIAQDINAFTATSLDFLIAIASATIQLIAFISVLWSISHLLVAILVVYSLFGTAVVALFGKKLVWLNFLQLRREADFRYGLIHVRNNAEAIAFYHGEEQENVGILSRLKSTVMNFRHLILWQRNLAFFTYGYQYFIQVLPLAIMAPLYFKNTIQFGVITQATSAFSVVLGSMTLIVSQMEGLTQFAAGITRLQSFRDKLLILQEKAGASRENNPQETLTTLPTTGIGSSRGQHGITIMTSDHLALENLTLKTPNGEQTLLMDATAAVPKESGLLIIGPSGAGKSSILRAFAGLWRTGEGIVYRPPAKEILFLPQKPYMLLGSLRDQLVYPNLAGKISDDALRTSLEKVNLPGLAERVGGLDAVQPWSELLSLGEQQRLTFARLLLTQPRYAILDESTSALDAGNEAMLYNAMRNMKSTFISVGHRPNLADYHDLILELKGQGRWEFRKA